MNKKIILLLISLLFLSGCFNIFKEERSPLITQDYHIKEDINNASNNLSNSIEKLDTTTNNIETEANNIKNKSREALLTNPTNPLLTNIEQSSIIIIEETEELRLIRNKLSLTKSKLEIIESKIEEINDNSKRLLEEKNKAIREKNKLKEDIKSGLNKLLKVVIVGSIIGIGVFVGLAAFGNIKGGLFGGTACIITLVLAIAVGKYIALIALIGCGVIIFALGLIGFHIYNERKTIKEIVETTEKVKEEITPEEKVKLFGVNKVDGVVKGIQNKNTEKIVKKYRKKLKIKKLENGK